MRTRSSSEPWMRSVLVDNRRNPVDAQDSRAPTRSRGGRWMVSVFGDINRTGSWRLRGRAFPISLFGDITLDLRHVSPPEDDAVIHAVTPVGDVKVLVGGDVRVDVDGFTLFGNKDIAQGESAPSAGAAV